jgi:hypothetical protein
VATVDGDRRDGAVAVAVALAALLLAVGAAGAPLPLHEASAAEADPPSDAAPHPGSVACERGDPPAGAGRGRGLTCPPDEADPGSGDPDEGSGAPDVGRGEDAGGGDTAGGGEDGGGGADGADGGPERGSGGSGSVGGDGSAGAGPSRPARAIPAVPTPAGAGSGADEPTPRAAAGLRTTEQPRGVPTIPGRVGEEPGAAPAGGDEVVEPSDREVADGGGGDVSRARPDARAGTHRIGGAAGAATAARIADGGPPPEDAGPLPAAARAAEVVQVPEVGEDRHLAVPVGQAVASPAEGGPVTVRLLAAGLLALLLVVAGAAVPRDRFRLSVPPVLRGSSIAAFVGLRRSRSDPRIAVASRGPRRTPRDARQAPPAAARRRGADREARPVAAPPRHATGAAALVARNGPAVPAPTLWAGTASVEARRERAAQAAQLAASEVATEARIAGSCLPAMPTVTAVALLVLGAVPTVTALDVLALAAAGLLIVLGVRWTWRLPTTPSRVFERVERRLDGQQRDLDLVRDALVLAKLNAAAGLDAATALDAAVEGDPDHPLQRSRSTPSSGSPALPRGESSMLDASLRAAEGTSGETAVAALSRCEARLHRHQGDVHRRRRRLVRVRAVGPFLTCALPATALVVVALAA